MSEITGAATRAAAGWQLAIERRVAVVREIARAALGQLAGRGRRRAGALRLHPRARAERGIGAVMSRSRIDTRGGIRGGCGAVGHAGPQGPGVKAVSELAIPPYARRVVEDVLLLARGEKSWVGLLWRGVFRCRGVIRRGDCRGARVTG